MRQRDKLRLEKQAAAAKQAKGGETTQLAVPPVPARKKSAQKRKTPASSSGNSSHHKKKTRKAPVKITYNSDDLSVPLPVGFKCKCEKPLDGDTTTVLRTVIILERRVRPRNIEECPPGIPVLEGPDPRDSSKDSKEQKVTARKSISSKEYDMSEHAYMYYVHYTAWDRRMDEWVLRKRLVFSDAEKMGLNSRSATPAPDASSASPAPAGDGKAAPTKMTNAPPNGGNGKAKRMLTGGKVANAPSPLEVEEDDDDDDDHDIHGDGGHGGSLHHGFTEEDLKAHEEATKVKNIDIIVIGKHEMSTWYYSPFPEEYNKFSKLYFCEFCLSFFGHDWEHKQHMGRCSIRHPPGNEIYRSQETNVMIAVYEVDGLKEKLFCQNLCYIAKLFLDHKTLEYDCTPFLFYVICEVDIHGARAVGYYSKEKKSAAGYNLACILTFPCHQRKGYGNFIISLSYELSKIEQKVGSPEKPISDLGLVSYRSYWSTVILTLFANQQPGDALSIDKLSEITRFTTVDIIDTLKYLKVLVWYRGKWVYSVPRLAELQKERAARIKRKQDKIKANPNAIVVQPCRPHLLHWTPFFANKRMRKQDFTN